MKNYKLNSAKNFGLSHVLRPLSHAGAIIRQLDTPVEDKVRLNTDAIPSSHPRDPPVVCTCSQTSGL